MRRKTLILKKLIHYSMDKIFLLLILLFLKIFHLVKLWFRDLGRVARPQLQFGKENCRKY